MHRIARPSAARVMGLSWTWQHGFGGPRARHPLVLFVGIYLAVILMGGARLTLFAPFSPTVRMASLSPTKEGVKIPDDVLKAVIGGKASDEQISEFRTATSTGEDALLKKSEREAIAGAKIVFWSETAAYLLKQDEPDLLVRGRSLASKYRVYLGMALGTWTPGAQYPLENKFVLIEPTGQIAWE